MSGFSEKCSSVPNFRLESLNVAALRQCSVLASGVCSSRPSYVYLFTSDYTLLVLDVSSGECQFAFRTDRFVQTDGAGFELYCSHDAKFVAITCSRERTHCSDALCYGYVFSTDTGEEILHLYPGDYHTELASFPFSFLYLDGRELAIHATDWNRLDITDLQNSKIITERDFSHISSEIVDEDCESGVEWNGCLKISPSCTRIATIGWVWHPIGVAVSYDLEAWLKGDKWATDRSHGIKSYAAWDYYWDSPFDWVGDNILCIWGTVDGTVEDNPPNSAALFDVDSEKPLLTILGPTNDIFFCDGDYLFSGISEYGVAREGVSVWSLKDGSLICQDCRVVVDQYLPGIKSFISFGSGGDLTVAVWEEGALLCL